jgi:hypothetical protein
MSKENKNTPAAQGATVETATNTNLPAVKKGEIVNERFSDLSGGLVTKDQATDIFMSGVFEEEGVEVTTKVLDKDFWLEKKGQDIPFIAQSIHTEPEGRNGAYDIVTGTALIDGEPRTVSIPQTVIVSTIKNNGLGAYAIQCKGMAKGKENDYVDFKITLKRLFLKSE